MEKLYIVLGIGFFILNVIIVVYFFYACINIKEINNNLRLILKNHRNSKFDSKPIDKEEIQEKKQVSIKEIENDPEKAAKVFLVILVVIILIIFIMIWTS